MREDFAWQTQKTKAFGNKLLTNGIIFVTKQIPGEKLMRNGVLAVMAFCLLFGVSACGQGQEKSNTATVPDKEMEEVKRKYPIKVGDTAPDFSLTNTKDEKTTLSEVKKSTMLGFYRGHW